MNCSWIQLLLLACSVLFLGFGCAKSSNKDQLTPSEKDFATLLIDGPFRSKGKNRNVIYQVERSKSDKSQCKWLGTSFKNGDNGGNGRNNGEHHDSKYDSQGRGSWRHENFSNRDDDNEYKLVHRGHQEDEDVERHLQTRDSINWHERYWSNPRQSRITFQPTHMFNQHGYDYGNNYYPVQQNYHNYFPESYMKEEAARMHRESNRYYGFEKKFPIEEIEEEENHSTRNSEEEPEEESEERLEKKAKRKAKRKAKKMAKKKSKSKKSKSKKSKNKKSDYQSTDNHRPYRSRIVIIER